MTFPVRPFLLGAVAVSVALPGAARSQTLDADRPLVLAQSSQSTEQDKNKRKEEKKGPPPAERKGPPPGPPPGPRPSSQSPPPPPPGPPPSKNVRTPPPDKGPAAFERKVPDSQAPPPRTTTPQPFEPKKSPELKKEPPKQAVPAPTGPPPGAPLAPPLTPKGPIQGVAPVPPKGPIPDSQAPRAPAVGAPAVQPGPRGPVTASPRFLDVQKGRTEQVDSQGRRVIQEPGNRVIVRQDNRVIIRHDEAERLRRRPGSQSLRQSNGHTETFYVRPDGMRVVTEVDGNGRLVRRYRRGPDGREFHIIDNRRFLRNLAIGVGAGAAVGLAIVALAPPRVTIPREKYIVDYGRASEDDIYEAFDAPPVDFLERAYSLDEIRDNYELRQRMRYVELNNITFESGAWEVTPDQYPKLERLARAMLRVLRRNPDEVFFVEGYTDAVGSDIDNLSLSDRRASAVADVLTETFGVPAENLVTQGYGEQFLKIDTQGPEPLNRRVQVRRVGPLMAER